MNKSIKKVLTIAVLFVFLISLAVTPAAASQVMWGKTELRVGQIGKVTVVKDSHLVKLDNNGNLTTGRAVKKGEEFRVYSYKGQNGGMYGVGGGSYLQKSNKVNYETPSKSKIALLKQMKEEGYVSKVVKNPASVKAPVEKPTNAKYQNCTEMRKVHPNGVKQGHPAYETRHDRDRDGQACEKN